MDDKFVRRKFLTSDPMQWKFLSLLLVSMLAPAFFVGGCLYFLIFKILSEQEAQAGFASFDLTAVIMKTHLVIIIGFAPLFLVLLVWGIILSHRFTGPMQRLQREIEGMAERGDFKGRLGVRKYDYIKPLVDAINKLLNKFCEMSPR